MKVSCVVVLEMGGLAEISTAFDGAESKGQRAKGSGQWAEVVIGSA